MFDLFDLINEIEPEATGVVKTNFEWCDQTIVEVRFEGGIFVNCEECSERYVTCPASEEYVDNCEGESRLLFTLINDDGKEFNLGWLVNNKFV